MLVLEVEHSGVVILPPTNSSQSDTFQLPAILRKVLLMQILQKQNETDRMQKRVLHSVLNRNKLSGKTAREHF